MEASLPVIPDRSLPFIELLRARGLTVIDLDRHFRIERANGDLTKWYCAQDAHYSRQAIEALAGLVAEEFEIESPKDSSMSLSAEILSLTGDQVVGSEWEGRLAGEELNLRAVLNNGDRGIEPDPKSPFLLLGDSHTLVFHQGKEAGMHCRGGGLLDHLSYQFGEAFDLVGVRVPDSFRRGSSSITGLRQSRDSGIERSLSSGFSASVNLRNPRTGL